MAHVKEVEKLWVLKSTKQISPSSPSEIVDIEQRYTNKYDERQYRLVLLYVKFFLSFISPLSLVIK